MDINNMETILILATRGKNTKFFQLEGNIKKVQSSAPAPCLKPIIEIEIIGISKETDLEALQDFAGIIEDLQENAKKSAKAAKIAEIEARIEHYQKRAANFYDLIAQEQGKLEKLKVQITTIL